jgi:hypothetical protein
MKALTRLTGLLGLAGFALCPQANAAELTLPQDGWASWEIAAVEGAPDWCCWGNWDNRAAPRKACQLDEDRNNSGSRDHTTTDAAKVYVRLAGGKIERLRVLSASCPVEAKTQVRIIDANTDDSARWFASLARQNSGTAKRDEMQDNVFAGLAMHRGDLAQDTLAAIARGDGAVETRKKAVFWLALLRGVAGADIVSGVMFNDKEAELRKHAAFATSQSRSPRIAADLIRLGNTDKDAEVRGDAWFWLAQTGAENAEEAIVAALRKDGNEHVRDKAIAALAQLPDERATRALIAVAQDRSMAQEHRKRAVFWLAQSESKVAQTYLERVLSGKGAD